ncbi:MAG: type II toxin-antitoxin system Phd/YefM family antitoxin [Leptospiraceae bacterium]|nr:type II toxin-antitoxin system Phd/YefM family antitoxin [Leptospiraceae bacterium]
MQEIKLSEAKAHLGRYLQRVRQGEGFIITDRNRPVARLVEIETPGQANALKIGGLKGQFTVGADFNDPLPEFEEQFYGLIHNGDNPG